MWHALIPSFQITKINCQFSFILKLNKQRTFVSTIVASTWLHHELKQKFLEMVGIFSQRSKLHFYLSVSCINNYINTKQQKNKLRFNKYSLPVKNLQYLAHFEGSIQFYLFTLKLGNIINILPTIEKMYVFIRSVLTPLNVVEDVCCFSLAQIFGYWEMNFQCHIFAAQTTHSVLYS